MSYTSRSPRLAIHILDLRTGVDTILSESRMASPIKWLCVLLSGRTPRRVPAVLPGQDLPVRRRARRRSGTGTPVARACRNRVVTSTGRSRRTDRPSSSTTATTARSTSCRSTVRRARCSARVTFRSPTSSDSRPDRARRHAGGRLVVRASRPSPLRAASLQSGHDPPSHPDPRRRHRAGAGGGDPLASSTRPGSASNGRRSRPVSRRSPSTARHSRITSSSRSSATRSGSRDRSRPRSVAGSAASTSACARRSGCTPTCGPPSRWPASNRATRTWT